MSRESPPKFDEFELSVIGPGRGECIIVHLGYNEWCVVDSCIGVGRAESAAVEYLGTFGQAYLDGVKLVVATHWHDDHIRGMASALKSFPNAAFSCSVALNQGQFVELVELVSTSLQRESGLDEFRAVYDVLLERQERKLGRNLVAPRFAIQNRELLSIPREDPHHRARITALSPSDGTFTESLRHIAGLMPTAGQPQRRIPNITPNSTSVVIWITVGSQSALLGADLEHSARVEEGWFAVLNAREVGDKADYFKVPHHGSHNGDCPDVWDKLLGVDPIAVVTPFTSGKSLPQVSDIERLCTQTPNLYCTSKGRRKPPRRDPTVDKLLRNVERFVVDEQLGHVRIRSSMTDNNRTVEMFNGAFKVDCRVALTEK